MVRWFSFIQIMRTWNKGDDVIYSTWVIDDVIHVFSAGVPTCQSRTRFRRRRWKRSSLLKSAIVPTGTSDLALIALKRWVTWWVIGYDVIKWLVIQFMAVGNQVGKIFIWDMANGYQNRPHQTLTHQKMLAQCRQCSFSPNGSILVAGNTWPQCNMTPLIM